MKYIKQRHKYGCGVACLAMVTGDSYETVRRAFTFDAAKTGLTVQHIIHYLSSLGYWIQLKGEVANSLTKQYYLRTVCPYIFMVQKNLISKFHFVILVNDKLYDPADKTNMYLDNYTVVAAIGVIK